MNIIRALLFPELRMGVQQSLPLEPTASRLIVQDVLQVMDLQQEAVARNLGEGHRVIHGPAGSGKTMILIYRAVQLQSIAREGKPILVLCFNKDLAQRIEVMLRLKGVGPAVQVSTFHSWARDLIKTYQLAPIKPGQLTNEDFEAFSRIACQGITSSRVPKGQYAAMLIDEAHDLADDWLAAAAQMVDPSTNSLLVLYDDAQSIYQKSRRKLSFAKLGIQAQGRTDILKINYRNTTEVLALAMECAGGILEGSAGSEDSAPTVIPQSAGRSGPVPTFHRFADGLKEAQHIADAVSDQVAQGRAPGEIAVLARTKRSLETIATAIQQRGIACVVPGDHRGGAGVKLTTLHSSKGLEFPVVYVAAVDQLDNRAQSRDEELRLLYVGMTRATHRLALTAVGRSAISDHVERALERVNQAYH
jgi:superfamily I DNA/RNA helicase